MKMTISVKAYITESGEIKAELPKDHPVGEVILVIEPPAELDETFKFRDADQGSAGLVIHRMMRTDVWDIYRKILKQFQTPEEIAEAETAWTDAELDEILKPNPKTLGEIVAEVEKSPGGYNALIGFDDANNLGTSPDQIVAAMKHMSLWDVYMSIVEECREEVS
jgi:hypothetical protein